MSAENVRAKRRSNLCTSLPWVDSFIELFKWCFVFIFISFPAFDSWCTVRNLLKFPGVFDAGWTQTNMFLFWGVLTDSFVNKRVACVMSGHAYRLVTDVLLFERARTCDLNLKNTITTEWLIRRTIVKRGSVIHWKKNLAGEKVIPVKRGSIELGRKIV